MLVCQERCGRDFCKFLSSAWASLSLFVLCLSLSLSPPIEVRTAVKTMLGKLSSLKRTSRCLAKTGVGSCVLGNTYVCDSEMLCCVLDLSFGLACWAQRQTVSHVCVLCFGYGFWLLNKRHVFDSVTPPRIIVRKHVQ